MASSSGQNFPQIPGNSAGPSGSHPGPGRRRISSAVTASRRADAHDSIRCQARRMPISSSSEAPPPRPSSPVASSQNEASATPGRARSSGALAANPVAARAASLSSAAARISYSGTPMNSGGQELSSGSREYPLQSSSLKPGRPAPSVFPRTPATSLQQRIELIFDQPINHHHPMPSDATKVSIPPQGRPRSLSETRRPPALPPQPEFPVLSGPVRRVG